MPGRERSESKGRAANRETREKATPIKGSPFLIFGKLAAVGQRLKISFVVILVQVVVVIIIIIVTADLDVMV